MIRGVGEDVEELRVFGMLLHPNVKRVQRTAPARNETNSKLVFRCFVSTKVADFARSMFSLGERIWGTKGLSPQLRL
jgi:hypothetical protein